MNRGVLLQRINLNSILGKISPVVSLVCFDILDESVKTLVNLTSSVHELVRRLSVAPESADIMADNFDEVSNQVSRREGLVGDTSKIVEERESRHCTLHVCAYTAGAWTVLSTWRQQAQAFMNVECQGEQGTRVPQGYRTANMVHVNLNVAR
jgi:hypothetical protein